jgi:hypothetical protein
VVGEIRDARMIKKAMEQRWPIDAEKRKAVVERLTKILNDPQSTAREATAAAKALMSAEAQNQADEQHHDDRMDEGRNRILDLLGREGSSAGAVVIEQRGKGIISGGDKQAPSRISATKNKGRKS